MKSELTSTTSATMRTSFGPLEQVEARLLNADIVRSMAQRAGATITEIESTHVVMVSQPEAVTDVIMTAAAAADRAPVAAGGRK
jgi:hypothetical protein